MQRRIVELFIESCEGNIQLLRGIASVATAINIAFQHLQAKPAALFFRHRLRHFLRQMIGFLQEWFGIMHQLEIGVLRVAIDGQL
ncbi:hypothetical protein D3C78_857140 [compost metagenome]